MEVYYENKNQNKALVLLATSLLVFGLSTIPSVVNAEVAHPAPSPIIDEWHYGVNGNYGYSNYLVYTENIGSKSSVTNFWGTVKAHSSQKYGWALSSATKSWNDVRLNAHWNYFYF
ncbi:hypothetical protein AB1F57_09450 [Streptococcus sp. ZY1909104]|uniref:hypothetical protein n=1 Tax=Streptococcus sp. ZY1909104 TaxID=3233335 RepID=UPI00349F45D4